MRETFNQGGVKGREWLGLFPTAGMDLLVSVQSATETGLMTLDLDAIAALEHVTACGGGLFRAGHRAADEGRFPTCPA